MDIFFATPLVIKPDGGVCGGGSWLACVLGNTSGGAAEH